LLPQYLYVVLLWTCSKEKFNKCLAAWQYNFLAYCPRHIFQFAQKQFSQPTRTFHCKFLPLFLFSAPWHFYLSYPWIGDVLKDMGVDILSYLDDNVSFYLLSYLASNRLALLRRIRASQVLPLFGTWVKTLPFMTISFGVWCWPCLGAFLRSPSQMGTSTYGCVVYPLLEAFEFKLVSLLV